MNAVQTTKRIWICTDCGIRIRDRYERTFCTNCVEGHMIEFPTVTLQCPEGGAIDNGSRQGTNHAVGCYLTLINDPHEPTYKPLGEHMSNLHAPDYVNDDSDREEEKLPGEIDYPVGSVRLKFSDHRDDTLGEKVFDVIINLSFAVALGSIVVATSSLFALWILGIDVQ